MGYYPNSPRGTKMMGLSSYTLVTEFGCVSNSFNVADLSPYDDDDLGASRSTPFEVGGDDEDIPITQPSPPTIDDPVVSARDKSNHDIGIGPIT
jgi:hypothetical protein